MGNIKEFEQLHTQYKMLLRDAYNMSKTDQSESAKLYAQADQMRSTLYAL